MPLLSTGNILIRRYIMTRKLKLMEISVNHFLLKRQDEKLRKDGSKKETKDNFRRKEEI